MAGIMRPDPYATTNKNEQKKQICISKGFSNEQKRTIVCLPFLRGILIETLTKQRRMSKPNKLFSSGILSEINMKREHANKTEQVVLKGIFKRTKTNNCSFVILKGDSDRNAHETKPDEQ